MFEVKAIDYLVISMLILFVSILFANEIVDEKLETDKNIAQAIQRLARDYEINNRMTCDKGFQINLSGYCEKNP